MKRYVVLLALLLALLIPSAAFGQSLTPADALVVASGETHIGDLATVSQPIVIDGVVDGDVTSIRGNILVRGVVRGDVISLLGDVTFEQGALPEGHVMAAAGTVSTAAPLDLAQGQAVFNGNLGDQGAAALIPNSGSQPISAGQRVGLILVLALLALASATLLSMLWPRSIEASSRVLAVAPNRALGLGMLWNGLVLLGGALLALFLIFSLIGLAVLPFVVLAAQIPYVAGLAVVGRTLGERMGRRGPLATALGGLVAVLPGIALAFVNLPAAFALFYLVAGAGVGGLFLMRSAVLRRNSEAY